MLGTEVLEFVEPNIHDFLQKYLCLVNYYLISPNKLKANYMINMIELKRKPSKIENIKLIIKSNKYIEKTRRIYRVHT